MKRVLIIFYITVHGFLALSQAQNSFVQFTGTVLSQKDSSALNAAIFYEKLPYYDDMGTLSTNDLGQFSANFYAGISYHFKISKDGYADFEETILVKEFENKGEQEMAFYIKPDSEPDLITLDNLNFSRGSDQISATSYEGLDELVIWLDARPSTVIQLEGHTDFAGNAEANMRLSEARVLAVKEYLMNKGIKKNRVMTKAFGGTQPISTERTDEVKARNRRVEVRVLRK